MVARQPEYCLQCGKQLKAKYRKADKNFIGDTFMCYEPCNHKSESDPSNPVVDEGWISVDDERKPEPNSFVLATIQTLHDRWVEMVFFGTFSYQLPGRGRTTHVACWMPLPKPPNT